MKDTLKIKVPLNSSVYFIDSVGCLRYSTFDGSPINCVKPKDIGEYLDISTHEMIGNIVVGSNKFVLIKRK